MLIPCSALRVLRIQPPKALTTPSLLVGEGWGGGSLLPRAVPQQLRPPPLTPPHPKSGLPDLRVVMRNSGKPEFRGEGNVLILWDETLERPRATPGQGRVAGCGVSGLSPRRWQCVHGGAAGDTRRRRR